MSLSYEQKRDFRRGIMLRHRQLARAFAVYQTPSLFREPEDSQLARERSVGFFPKIQSAWSSPEEFLSAKAVRKGVHSVWYEGLPIDFELSKNRADILLVVFHGALELKTALPIFSGSNVASGLKVARLSFTDPSLYLSPELALGWHAGNVFQPDLQAVTSALIEKISSSVGAKRIILFGSSGGGFASLMQLPALPTATAVVSNAQTDIFRYHDFHVKKYLNTAWSGDREVFIKQNSHSAIQRIEMLNRVPRVYFLQNSTDTFHIAGHLNPFLEAARGRMHVSLLTDNWGSGHVAPPKRLFQATLSAVVQRDELTLKSLGFKPVIG